MTSSRVPRGRPRSEASRRQVLAATFALLCEEGYAGVLFERVAERSGVAKTTLYRWWPDRAALALDAFFEATEAELRFPDTGSARADFAAQIAQLAALLRSPAGAALAAMIEGGRTDSTLRRAIGERWVLPRKRWGVERMQRAQAEGECATSISIDGALDALYGPLYARLLLGLGAPTPAQVEAYLGVVLVGIFGPASDL